MDNFEDRQGRSRKGIIGIVVTLIVVIGLAIGAFLFFQEKSDRYNAELLANSAVNEGRNIAPPQAPSPRRLSDLQKDVFHFSSIEDNVEMDFPSQPSRESEESFNADLGNSVETITYQVSTASAMYYMTVVDYANEKMSVTNSNFSVDGALQGSLNGMVNAYPDGKIISQHTTTMNSRPAIRFLISAQGELFEGFVTYDGMRLYTGMVEYFSGDTLDLSVEKFLNSFAFMNEDSDI